MPFFSTNVNVATGGKNHAALGFEGHWDWKQLKPANRPLTNLPYTDVAQDIPLPPYNVVKTHTMFPYISTRITPAIWALSEGVKSHSLTTLRAHCPCRPNSINAAIMTNATPASCPTIKTIVQCIDLLRPLSRHVPPPLLSRLNLPSALRSFRSGLQLQGGLKSSVFVTSLR